MEKDVKIALIGGFFAVLVCVLYVVLPHLLYPTISNIEIVDAYVSYEETPAKVDELEMEVCQPVLDLKVKNVGDGVAIIKRVDIEVLDCMVYPGILHTSAEYEVKLVCTEKPYTEKVHIAHRVDPNDVDRFRIRFTSDYTAEYLIRAYVVYDNKKVETENMKIVFIPGHQ